MSEWKSEVLVKCLESVIDYRGKTPKKSEHGIVTLSAKSVKMGEILYDRAFYISKETYKSFMVRGFPKIGDILLTTEAPLGCVARLDRADVGLAQRLITLRGKTDLLDNGYLLYYLMSNIGQHELHVRATGTTVQGIKRSEFEKVIINLPPLSEQKAIAHILGKLDDKIELNRQMNQSLEAMAQALFKSWFVDFDPVIDNALAAGPDNYRERIPPGLQAMAEKRKLVPNSKKLLSTNPELAAKFPSFFVFNETLDKWIPEGWEVKRLGELSQLKYGTMPKKQNLGVGEFVTYSGYKYIDKYPLMNCEEGSLIVVARGVGGTGDVKLVERDCYLTNLSIMMNTENYNKYLYYLLAPKGLKHLDSGSAQSQITSRDLSLLNVEIAPKSVLNAFEKIERSIYKKGLTNKSQTETLTQLRDTLLPQLISGKVRVPVEMMEGD